MRRLLPAIALSTLGACSFVLVEGPPRDHREKPRVECTERRVGPVLDLVLSAYLLGAALGFAVRGDDERPHMDHTGLLVTHAGLGLLSTAGAIYGFARTGACREAKALAMARMEENPELALSRTSNVDPTTETWHGASLEATVGGFYGQGWGVRVERGVYGARFGAGWQPIFYGTSVFPVIPFYRVTDMNPPQDIFHAVQVNADLHRLFLRVSSRAEVGFTIGYRYSTLLGHGAAAGIYTEINRGERWGLFGVVGGIYYAEAEERIVAEEGLPEDTDLIPDLTAAMSIGVHFSP